MNYIDGSGVSLGVCVGVCYEDDKSDSPLHWVPYKDWPHREDFSMTKIKSSLGKPKIFARARAKNGVIDFRAVKN